jgi:hypothetical protein
MKTLLLFCCLFTSEPELAKAPVNAPQLTIYVDSSIQHEKQFQKLMESNESISLVNPKVFKIVSAESIKRTCTTIDVRIIEIKQRFNVKFLDRYGSDKPYGIRFNYGKTFEIPETLDLVNTISMVEYYIDLVYYDLEIKQAKEAYEEARDKWIVDDYLRRHKFAKNLFLRNFKLEGYIPVEENDELPSPSQLPLKIFDEKGNLKSFEDLGYQELPKPEFQFRARKESPIKLD